MLFHCCKQFREEKNESKGPPPDMNVSSEPAATGHCYLVYVDQKLSFCWSFTPVTDGVILVTTPQMPVPPGRYTSTLHCINTPTNQQEFFDGILSFFREVGHFLPQITMDEKAKDIALIPFVLFFHLQGNNIIGGRTVNISAGHGVGFIQGVDHIGIVAESSELSKIPSGSSDQFVEIIQQHGGATMPLDPSGSPPPFNI